MTLQENLTTLAAHLGTKPIMKDAPGDLPGLIGSIGIASKSIAAKIRRARISDVLGSIGDTNVQGEVQEKLDVISDELVIHCVSKNRSTAVCASEEQPHPVVVRTKSEGGDYCALFDPLDGSSNIDVAAGVGTIFSILPNDEADDDTSKAVLQPGHKQVAAGYTLYGSSVLMVLTVGDGVDMFVLDPDLGEFVLVQEKLEMPASKKIRSLNGAYRNEFPQGYQDYLAYTEKSGYGSRYIGSMVADIHRTLLKGGVFLYPPTAKAPEGKLRLMYEANPMSMLMEQAGGKASNGAGRILDVVPKQVHERTPVVMGSRDEVDAVLQHVNS